ncbi:Protein DETOXIFICATION 36, partial [Bienertia sinuspersici]
MFSKLREMEESCYRNGQSECRCLVKCGGLGWNGCYGKGKQGTSVVRSHSKIPSSVASKNSRVLSPLTSCQSVIDRLSRATAFFTDLDTVLANILALSRTFISISWSYINRDGNCVAHHLAKLVPFGIEH